MEVYEIFTRKSELLGIWGSTRYLAEKRLERFERLERLWRLKVVRTVMAVKSG